MKNDQPIKPHIAESIAKAAVRYVTDPARDSVHATALAMFLVRNIRR